MAAAQIGPWSSIIRQSSGAVFDSAAQIWNRSFYWNSLSLDGGGVPAGALGRPIEQAFGSFESFQ